MTGQEIPSQVVELAAPDQFIPPLPGWAGTQPERHGRDAHQRYNALIRRLVSYERAAERIRSVRQRSTG